MSKSSDMPPIVLLSQKFTHAYYIEEFPVLCIFFSRFSFRMMAEEKNSFKRVWKEVPSSKSANIKNREVSTETGTLLNWTRTSYKCFPFWVNNNKNFAQHQNSRRFTQPRRSPLVKKSPIWETASKRAKFGFCCPYSPSLYTQTINSWPKSLKKHQFLQTHQQPHNHHESRK